MVKFDATKAEARIIRTIAERAVRVAASLDISYMHLEAEMDITATHRNGNPLRLAELAEADDFNFNHDVFGIRRHLDRETGKLSDFFSPRYSARAVAA